MKNFTTFAQSFALALALGLPSTCLADTKAAEKTPEASPTEAAAEQTAKAEEKPAATADGKTDDKATDKKEGDKAAEPAAEGAAKPAALDSTTQNLTLKLRAQIDKIDQRFALIKEPTSMLSSMLESRKERIEQSLIRIDETALELAALQEEFNKTNTGAYSFTCESDEDRYKYTNDGEAAYKLMMNDLKDRSLVRKAMGLNKFEIFEENFMGIEGYEEAYRIYALTVEGLDKKWMKAKLTEEKKRDKLAEKKLEALEKADDRAMEILSKKAEAAGYDLSKDWYCPEAKNLAMLDDATSHSNRTVREIERRRKDKAIKGVGAVSPLIVAFWAAMDEVRNLMVSGDLDGAKKLLESDPCFNNVLRLDRRLFPEDYCGPLREEYRDLGNTIRERERDKRSLEHKLETQTNRLEREVDNTQSQISAILEEIEKELALQNETDAEEAVQMSEADRLKASQDADKENTPSTK